MQTIRRPLRALHAVLAADFFFILILLLCLFVVGPLGGCADTIAPGQRLTQRSDEGLTEAVGFTSAVGIREPKLNWTATGPAGTKATRLGGEDGIVQIGATGATRQVFWDPALGKFILSSETDFQADRAVVYGEDGKKRYEIEGFRTNASDPTKAFAIPLEAMKEVVEVLAPFQRDVLRDKLQAQVDAAKAAGEVVAPSLLKLIELLASP